MITSPSSQRPVLIVFRYSIALLSLVAAVALMAGFPAGFYWVHLLLLTYFSVCVLRPSAWLLLLPTMLIALDVTPWSGRAGLNEFDAVILLTLAAGLFRKREEYTARYQLGSPLLLACFGVYTTVLAMGAVASGGIETSSLLTIPYYQVWYPFLQTRGLIYALLLLMLWLHCHAQNPESSERWLLRGTVFGSLTFLLVVFWERGVLSDLLGGGAYYALFNNLLDFTTPYRITGLLSDMHTGGESIDGLLMAMMPFALVAFVFWRGWWQAVAAIAFLGVSYGVVATFTRTTYASYGFCLLVFILLYGLLLNRGAVVRGTVAREVVNRSLTRREKHYFIRPEVALLLLPVAALWLFGEVYKLSGYIGIVACGGIIFWRALCSAFGWLQSRSWLLWPGYLLAIGLGVYGQITSKWNMADAGLVAKQTALLVLLCGCAHLFFRRFSVSKHHFLIVPVVIGIMAVGTATTSGYRMTERASSVVKDFGTRTDHWASVYAAMDTDWLTKLVGMGRGSFPAAYGIRYPDSAAAVGGLQVASDDEGHYLHLAASGDMLLAQRLPIMPNRDYTVDIQLRSESDAGLLLGFCERNILIAAESSFTCSNARLRVEAKGKSWESYQIAINSKGVGSGDIIQRWPTSFFIRAGSEPLEIKRISLRLGELRVNMLENPGFEQGLDYWYTYNDIQHLPWHIKNLYLSIFFEAGILGCVLFGLLLFRGGLRGINAFFQGSLIAMAVTLSVLGVLGVGAMGNPLDSARVSSYFYWMLLVLVATPFTGMRSCGGHSPGGDAPTNVN